jgi:hypothetical protein
LWEEEAKGPEGKSSWQKINPKEQNLHMLRPGTPEKAIKGFLARNKGPIKIIKSRPTWRIGGLIMSQPIMSMSM